MSKPIKQHRLGWFAREIARAEGYVMARDVSRDGVDGQVQPYAVPEKMWDALPDADPRMLEMVERVARVLVEHNGYNPDGAAGGPGEKVWETAIPFARVVIAAMNEPT
jgi:hypothetical protein